MKRCLAFVCMLSVFLMTTPVLAATEPSDPFYTEVSLENIYEISSSDTNVLELSPVDIKSIDSDRAINQLNTFLYSHGLIVYRNEKGITSPILDDYLNLPTQESARSVPASDSIESNSVMDAGKDIAIIYYLDNQGAISTHTILCLLLKMLSV